MLSTVILEALDGAQFSEHCNMSKKAFFQNFIQYMEAVSDRVARVEDDNRRLFSIVEHKAWRLHLIPELNVYIYIYSQQQVSIGLDTSRRRTWTSSFKQ